MVGAGYLDSLSALQQLFDNPGQDPSLASARWPVNQLAEVSSQCRGYGLSLRIIAASFFTPGSACS